MIPLKVNGIDKQIQDADGSLPLIVVLHERLGLTGTKLACGIGVCHACTVAVRRHTDAALEPLLACSVPVDFLAGADVLTIEGLAPNGDELSDVQRAFLEQFAFQCGYCTPGFAMAGFMLLEQAKRSPVPREAIPAAVEAAIGAHLCRCTGYAGYHRALENLLTTTLGGA
jgi:aerobic-type carbon monoxide dehydrogenase small subunit (CoxS/CutS family)